MSAATKAEKFDPGVAFEYGLEDRPNAGRSLLFGLQHVLVMFTAMIAEPLIIGIQLKLPPAQVGFMLSATMAACGVSAFLQTRRIWFVGASLPLVAGSFLIFIGPIVAVSKAAGLAAAFFGLFLAALVQFVVFSWLFSRIARFFPPIVVGTSITIVGLYLLPIGISTAFGANSPFYGKPSAVYLALFTLIAIIALNRYARGFIKTISVLAAIIAGYVVAAGFGMVDFSPVANAAWFAVPRPFPFGAPAWPGTGAFLILLVLFLITAMEVIGTTLAVCGVVNVKVTNDRLRGAVAADGLASALSALFGGSPLVAYTQNVGLISATGVASRHVVAWGGLILLAISFSPKFAALIIAIPKPVLGAALLVAWGLVVAVGTSIVRQSFTAQRDIWIYSVSVAIGFGIVVAPADAYAYMPYALKLFLQAGPVVGVLLAFSLNLLLPKTENESGKVSAARESEVPDLGSSQQQG